MSFTMLYAFLTLFALALVFGVAYQLKGWKVALLAAGVTLVLAALGLLALLFLVVRMMGN